ncbi:uncharacterized protein MELLADRAFT_110129 [Melampsora larici-populina 98AG31]|uniref:Uncharacterized protein n=1 Tax=Melampsora larici-populina (strain 98AG31 / pathotype 3-4-7) TaxID=747676 RepID=F4RYS0_MELLP|nr:uncharacterized protein MELLADRAFT_110129 [Melampsora larici-populina 98AG31]EGG02520.1 hypothetical protein MELLADRAFT_110129 [Melampsora larici-populina 98AG31]
MTEASDCKNWKSIRPWLPPNGLSNRFESQSNNDNNPNEEEEGKEDENDPRGKSRIRSNLNVIDVSSTAISLDVSYQLDDISLRAPISLAVKINGIIWEKVAYAESDVIGSVLEDTPPTSPSCEQSSSESELKWSRGHRNITLVIHGLEPGLEYEVELELIPLTQEHHKHDCLSGSSDLEETSEESVEHEGLLCGRLDPSIESGQEIQSIFDSETNLHEQPNKGERTNDTKPEPIITQLDPDGPPPPYTSHDPASPRASRSLHASHSSLDYNPESSQQPPSPRTSSSIQPSTPVRTNGRDREGNIQTVVKTSENNSKHNELKLVSSINQMTKALNKTVKENLKLRQKLVNVEQFIKRLDEENLVKSNRLESLERLEKKRRPSTANGQHNNNNGSSGKKESGGDPMNIEGFTPLWVLERQIEVDEIKIMEKQIELEESEKRQAKELMEFKDKNRSLKRKVEESFKRVSDLKDRKLKEIDLELEEIKNELEEVEKLLNAESNESNNTNNKKFMGKSSSGMVKGHGDPQSRRSMGKWNHHAKMKSNEDLQLNVNSKSGSSGGSTSSHKLARTSSLNEKSRTTERVVGGGRRSMKEPHQVINRTWADKVAGH